MIAAFDGRTDLRSETDLFACVLENRVPGKRVEVMALRDGRRQTLKLQMKQPHVEPAPLAARAGQAPAAKRR